MEMIGTYWWVWLLATLVFGGYVLYNQIRRIRGMMKNGMSGDMDKAFSSFHAGIVPLVVSALLVSVAGGLLLFSILINLIDYYKA